MARYATAADLQSPALGLPAVALEGVGEDQGLTVDQVCEAALDAACDVADGYLGQRFTLPLLEYGQDLAGAVCAIAAFTVMAGRGFSPNNDSDNVLVLRHENAMKWLRDIAKGLVLPAGLVDSSTTPAATPPLRAQVRTRPSRSW